MLLCRYMEMPKILQDKLEKYSGRLPFPVASLAKDFGIDVYGTEDLEDRQSGMIKKEGDKYVIYVNERHPAVRQRFTIAHEIAHFVKHRSELDRDQEHLDFITQPVNGERVLHRADRVMTEPEREMEKEANELAAQILMPADKFKALFETANSIEEVAEKFGVSSAAATIRAKSLFGEVMF